MLRAFPSQVLERRACQEQVSEGKKCFKETRNMLSSSKLKKMLKVKPRAIGKDRGVGTFDEK